MDFEQRFRAIDARDTRFDGQFFTAVRTTGIYCRPSCPARTPHRENVTFYATSAAAHEAGYRACKRCLPEATPGTPEWNLRSDVAARAMRLIIDGEMNAERGGVDQLAKQLGYSSRQLGRILRAELGAGPLSLARAARAQTARTLLISTEMKFADIAFASGFSSIRQFNETIQQIFDSSPGQLRTAGLKRHPQNSVTVGPGTTLELRLPLRPPYDAGIFSFLAARAIDGVELASSESYSRTLALKHGKASIEVRLPELSVGLNSVERAWATDHLRLKAHLDNLKDLPTLLARVRRVFDLDADPLAIDHQLSRSEALSARVASIPGIRLPGAVDPAEMLLRAMVGQQITVVAARGQLHRLATLGAPFEDASGQLQRVFPTPQQLVEGSIGLLRGPARRIESIHNAMRQLAEGLHLGLDDDLDSLRAKLLPLPGIGPWTVNYVAMRFLAATDIHLDGDVAVRKGLGLLNLEANETDALSPWRSYATLHFWRTAAESSAKTSSQGKP
ncbi:DNA-3-methyladenine glycosylase 2 family protein [Psychromicrobium lacuslunae]|uniref:DNA-3-methyladenine glycosylase II n=1 Tax=Psychromicrobium lacuslunae TaxID=1618207 RepID=A0A0D4BWE9_9MICC|nr:AlkA N-terminal domain-containing protein [Psychromicrobium lacuslunae]AJT40633.1 3-methyladenine DNA glycosylase [Psychromicrobium lacuslunae]